MKYCKPRYRAGKRDVKPAQAIGLAGGDPTRFAQHNMVELKPLGQRDRNDRQSVISRHFGSWRLGRAEDAEGVPGRGEGGRDLRDLGVGADHGDRARSLGQSLSGYLRDLMDADAAAETNAEVIARIARDREPVDLTMDDILAARDEGRR